MKRAVSGINTWRVVNQLARDFDLNRSQKEPKEEEEEKREEEEDERFGKRSGGKLWLEVEWEELNIEKKNY